MRDKLVELLRQIVIPYWADIIADYLIAHGVALAKDNNVLGKKPLTNGDRIRAMTDEQLATFLDCFSGCAVCRESERLDDNPFLKDEKCDEDCEAHILEWLKQPAEVDR